MNIRKAKYEDYDLIVKLRKPILTPQVRTNYELSQSGFLIGDYSIQDFEKDMKDIFLVALKNKEVVGYIVLSKVKEYLDNESKVWNEEAYKEKYYSLDTIEIKVLCVSGSYANRGLGSALLETSLDLLNAKYKRISSIITLAPVPNYKSLNFHLHKGFKVVSISLPQKLFGFENYQSILLMKELM